jgi:ribosomal protein S18 acetylase RimI-like enzyme
MEGLINKIKQFGVIGGFRRFVYLILRPIFKIKSNIILAIPSHIPKHSDTSINILTENKIEDFFKSGSLTLAEADKFTTFLKLNCEGFYIEKENRLAAWGFNQCNGKYQYGSEEYIIPENVCVLKNLYVHPKFRGESLGKLMNDIRINQISIGKIPVGFVIPENKYALRNLKMFGFEEYIRISNTTWFNRWKKQRISILKSNNITDILMQGFNQNTTL